jgi:hypothetical protein
MKDGALGFVRLNPQPATMGLNDRPADGQTHPHTARLRSKYWIEYLLKLLRANSWSVVRHRYNDACGVMDLGPDVQEPGPILRRHRVDGVCDQVQKHLLELDSISSDFRYVCIRRCLDQYAVLLQMANRMLDEPPFIVRREYGSRRASKVLACTTNSAGFGEPLN